MPGLLALVLSVLRTVTLRDNEVDYLYFKIDRIEHIFALSLQVSDVEFKVFQSVRNAKEVISSGIDKASNTDDQQYYMEKVSSKNRGRPPYDIQKAQLQFFVVFGFKVSDMVKMLSVSEVTVKRRLLEYGISLS